MSSLDTFETFETFDTLDLIVASSLVGFFGDLLLQIFVHFGIGDWGLKEYFHQHGKLEAMTIASGMMSLFYILYFVVLKLPAKYEYLAVYGIILDLIFRETMLFPSLKGYYNALNYFESAVWGAIPLVLPLLMVDFYHSYSEYHKRQNS